MEKPEIQTIKGVKFTKALNGMYIALPVNASLIWLSTIRKNLSGDLHDNFFASWEVLTKPEDVLDPTDRKLGLQHWPPLTWSLQRERFFYEPHGALGA